MEGIDSFTHCSRADIISLKIGLSSGFLFKQESTVT